MKTYTLSFKILFICLFSLTLLSCGSFQITTYEYPQDSIYDSNTNYNSDQQQQQRVTQAVTSYQAQPVVSQASKPNSNSYSIYFNEKAKEYDWSDYQGQVHFTETDGYTSNNDNNITEPQAQRGSSPQNTQVYIVNNPIDYGYGGWSWNQGRNWNQGWDQGWNSNQGLSIGWNSNRGWDIGWNWGFNDFYNPYGGFAYNSWGYNNFGFYNPYGGFAYNGWGYNNFGYNNPYGGYVYNNWSYNPAFRGHQNNRIHKNRAYTNSRRGEGYTRTTGTVNRRGATSSNVRNASGSSRRTSAGTRGVQQSRNTSYSPSRYSTRTSNNTSSSPSNGRRSSTTTPSSSGATTRSSSGSSGNGRRSSSSSSSPNRRN